VLSLPLLCSQAGPKIEPKPPDAATILDRFVAATGGADAYRKFAFERVESSLVLPNGVRIKAISLRSRDGRRETLIGSTAQPTRSGVTKGVAWELAPATGARLLTGDAEKDALARSHGFDIDTWREEYPKVETIGEEVVNGKDCYHLKVTRTDGGQTEQYLDKQSNLLVREDESTKGVKTVVTVDAWATAQGIKYTSSFHMNREGQEISFVVEKVEFLAEVPAGVLVMPEEIGQLMKTTSVQLPNAADLMDHYIDSTGGPQAYATVKTQLVKAGMTFVRQGMKAELEAKIGEGGKSYVSLDLPGAGKFELGNNGRTSWQKNVMQGPQLTAQNPSKGIFGPTAEEVLQWKQTFDKIETISKQDVNGSPCYLVKMTLKNRKDESTACFDASSGFLVKLTTLTEVQGNKIPVDMVMSDYRAEGPLKMAHHLETLMAGQPITIELTEVVINPTLPESTFVLPPDVQALVEQARKDSGPAAHPKNAPQ